VSRSIDLFIRSSKPPDEVAADLSRVADLTLVRDKEPDTWALEHSDVQAQLRAHHFIDDGDLVLERYQYALSSRIEHGGRPTDSRPANLFRQVSARLRAEGMDCLLVHDLQYRDGGPRSAEDSTVASESPAEDLADQAEAQGPTARSEEAQ